MGARLSGTSSVGSAVSSSMVPDVDATRDIGSGIKRWRKEYLSSNLAWGTAATDPMLRPGASKLSLRSGDDAGHLALWANDINTDGSILPVTDDSSDIGSEVLSFRTTRITGYHELKDSAAAPSTPSAGRRRVYARDASLKIKFSDGIERSFTMGAGGLWMPPEAPSTDNEEFESTTKPAAWSDAGTDGGAVDVYTAFATAGTKKQSFHTNLRRSWWMCQPSTDGGFYGLYRDYSFAASMFVWARVCCNTHAAAATTNNDRSVALMFLPAAANGVPGNDSAQIWLQETDAGVAQSQFTVLEAGVTVTNTVTEDQAVTNTHPYQPEYIGMQWIQSTATLHGWVGFPNGAWCWMGSRVYAGAALGEIALLGYNSENASPANSVFGADFIRIRSGSGLP